MSISSPTRCSLLAGSAFGSAIGATRLASAALAETPVGAKASGIQPFTTHFPASDPVHLHHRIAATSLPERETVVDDWQGVQIATATPKSAPRFGRYPARREEGAWQLWEPRGISTVLDAADTRVLSTPPSHSGKFSWRGLMNYSAPAEGFRIAYDRMGSRKPVVLLHGWPGDRTDYNALAPILAQHADVIVPALRGFGQSDKHLVEPETVYSAPGQAKGVIALMDELGLKSAVLGGYDVGSLTAQTVASMRPDLVSALVVSPPLPGAGSRILDLKEAKEFWYTTFHQQKVAEELLDGKPEAIRAYLRHFWSHWSGPKYVVDEQRLNHLVEVYSPKGAFTASLGWYRSSGNPVTAYTQEVPPAAKDRLTTPTTVLWQEYDPIFPQHWSDRLDQFFTDFELEYLPGVGHYTPIEATETFAKAILRRLG